MPWIKSKWLEENWSGSVESFAFIQVKWILLWWSQTQKLLCTAIINLTWSRHSHCYDGRKVSFCLNHVIFENSLVLLNDWSWRKKNICSFFFFHFLLIFKRHDNVSLCKPDFFKTPSTSLLGINDRVSSCKHFFQASSIFSLFFWMKLGYTV